MKHSNVGNNYAAALFQIAKENQAIDQFEAELRVLSEVFNAKEIIEFLQSPRVSLDEKKETIKNACGNISPYIINTIQILVDRHRADHIVPMANKFIELSYEYKGIAVANVESVRALTDEEKAALISVYTKRLGKSALEIHNKVNSDLLGGLKIQIGNRIYDGSLRGKLDRLQHELAGYQP